MSKDNSGLSDSVPVPSISCDLSRAVRWYWSLCEDETVPTTTTDTLLFIGSWVFDELRGSPTRVMGSYDVPSSSYDVTRLVTGNKSTPLTPRPPLLLVHQTPVPIKPFIPLTRLGPRVPTSVLRTSERAKSPPFSRHETQPPDRIVGWGQRCLKCRCDVQSRYRVSTLPWSVPGVLFSYRPGPGPESG